MKQQISPGVLATVVVVALVVLGFIGYRVWGGPSATAAPPPPPVSKPGAMTDRGGSGLQGAGGPPPEALRARDEYNRAHPDAAGSK